MRHYPELLAALSSPIPSVRTPFLQDGEIDFDGLRRYVEQCLANGARALRQPSTYASTICSVTGGVASPAVTK
jgi:hypothetical protein